MKVTCVSLIVAASALASAPCRADPALAGAVLATSSHGQPFCTDQGDLQAYLRAAIAGEKPSSLYYRSCLTVPDNTKVEVIEDLSPRTRYMHVVRARVYFLTGATDAYTYSVGLYGYPVGIRIPPPLPYFK